MKPGGGFGGNKESGQLRFGARDRPYRKPISGGLQSERRLPDIRSANCNDDGWREAALARARDENRKRQGDGGRRDADREMGRVEDHPTREHTRYEPLGSKSSPSEVKKCKIEQLYREERSQHDDGFEHRSRDRDSTTRRRRHAIDHDRERRNHSHEIKDRERRRLDILDSEIYHNNVRRHERRNHDAYESERRHTRERRTHDTHEYERRHRDDRRENNRRRRSRSPRHEPSSSYFQSRDRR